MRPAWCVVQVITPFNVYFNTHLIFKKGEVWRLLTNFFFFGNLGKHQHYSTQPGAASKAAVSQRVVMSCYSIISCFCLLTIACFRTACRA